MPNPNLRTLNLLSPARPARGHRRSARAVGSALALALTLMATACGAAEDLIEETSSSIDVSELSIPEVSIPDVDLNAPDFTVPDIVAPDINIDIDITEAPDLPVIRFPDAITIEVAEITSPEVQVQETDEATIYTISGQVLFDFDRADLRPEAIGVLEEILASVADRGDGGRIEVAGHSDAIGAAGYNYDLSVRRATGVALWFRERVPADQDIQAIGYGETQPVAPNTLPDGSDDPTGRTQNRRVEIIVTK
jgi:outer membrane protein OmpA-like peptidoglycan-associated protein